MFTGIVEGTGIVTELFAEGSNLHVTLQSGFAHELKPDQSVAHNGVCLTVTEVLPQHYKVTAVAETLRKSNLGLLKTGDAVNLERSLRYQDRIDGHFVQGHVDVTARCRSVADENGSHLFTFDFDPGPDRVLVSKGSVCVNGVSLTVIDPAAGSFSVVVIPYTFAHTNFNQLRPGGIVNLEFDILGKYIAALMAKKG